MKFRNNLTSSLRYTKQLIDSNYGRRFGWFVEYEGRIVAELEDFQPVDMFWNSYRIVPGSIESEEIAYNNELWSSCSFTFINRGTGERVSNAWAGGSIQNGIDNDRVTIRGLYLCPRKRIESRLIQLYEIFHYSSGRH